MVASKTAPMSCSRIRRGALGERWFSEKDKKKDVKVIAGDYVFSFLISQSLMD